MSASTPQRSLSFGAATALLALSLLLNFGVSTLAVTWLESWQGLHHEEAVAQLQTGALSLALIQFLSLLVVIALALRFLASSSGLREALSFGPLTKGQVLLCLLAGASFQFPAVELNNMLGELGPAWSMGVEEQRRLQRLVSMDSPWEYLTVPVAIVLLPALGEELFFRAILLRHCAGRYGVMRALVFSALCFGLVHGAPSAIVYASLSGVLLGMLFWRYRSIWSSLCFHAAFNALPVVLTQTPLSLVGFNVVSDTPQHLPVAVWAGSLLVFLGCYARLMLAGDRRILAPGWERGA